MWDNREITVTVRRWLRATAVGVIRPLFSSARAHVAQAYWPYVAQTAQHHRLRIVSPRYGAEVVGGAERLARLLAGSLHGAGWKVEVLTTCARDAATWRNA